MTTAAVVTSLAISLGSLVTQTSASAAATSTRYYSASSETFANPDRGYYRYSETHFTGGQPYTPLTVAALTRGRVDDDVTLIFRYFYLEKYRSVDTISAGDLALIRADLATAKAAGVKLIVRFAYTASSGADAPVDRVLKHIAQLAPLLNDYSEVITAIQAGFVGQWGEWYYTDNFANNPLIPWNLNFDDWAKRRLVLTTLLDATNPTIPVQVRYPSIKRGIFADLSDARANRVGIHNDCFLASADDYGTLVTDQDRTWLARQTESVLMGGETCAVNAPRSLWDSAQADLKAYHWTYLNADYNGDVLRSWGTVGRETTERRLGYRLRIVSASLPTEVEAGDSVPAKITLVNDGFAAPSKDRPVQLILRDSNNHRWIVPVETDTRTWLPGQKIELSFDMYAPTQAGRYKLYLNLPDPSSSLRKYRALSGGGGSVNSAYAIRLANTDMWDATRGWNNLQHEVAVIPSTDF